MDKAEVAKLLTQASLVDNRRITEAHVEQWWRILSHLDFAECERAIVEHFKVSNEYLQPRHLVAIVKRQKHDAAAEAHSKKLQQAYTPTGNYPGKPSNMDAMVDFYRKLAASGDWSHGQDPDEAARRVGLTPPVASWD